MEAIAVCNLKGEIEERIIFFLPLLIDPFVDLPVANLKEGVRRVSIE
jgi:hypothetical protein